MGSQSVLYTVLAALHYDHDAVCLEAYYCSYARVLDRLATHKGPVYRTTPSPGGDAPQLRRRRELGAHAYRAAGLLQCDDAGARVATGQGPLHSRRFRLLFLVR